MKKRGKKAETSAAVSDQPGLGRLREAVETARAPEKTASIGRDAIAGLTGAINNVPDGMASATLAGVNPVFGLYASIFGPLVGGVFASSQLMVVATTSAASLVAGQSLDALPFEGRGESLFLLAILCGAFQLTFGVLRLGRLVRFVSFSVMTGLIAGVALILILSQLPTITGIPVAEKSILLQTISLVGEIDSIRWANVAFAATTIGIATIFNRTRLRFLGSLFAIAVPSLFIALTGIEGIQLVRDAGSIPSGFFSLSLPSLSAMSPGILTGALAVAVISLVQGAGVSQSVPNPNGSRSSISKDFMAQGAANIAAGLFRGLPVGGSVGATALNVVAGARSRWAAIFAGLWMAAIILIFPGVVARVAMPSLGGLLVLAGLGSIKVANLESIYRAGFTSYLAGGVTFLATLALPIQAAVGVGLVLSALLVIYESASDISVVEVITRPDGRIEEHPAPQKLASHAVTVLDVYGPLFFSGARALERILPSTEGVKNAAVILRLRGQVNHEATLIDVLTHFSNRLARIGGRLFLTGINQESYQMVSSSEKLLKTGTVTAYQATPVVWASTQRALSDARKWLAERVKSENTNGGKRKNQSADAG